MSQSMRELHLMTRPADIYGQEMDEWEEGFWKMVESWDVFVTSANLRNDIYYQLEFVMVKIHEALADRRRKFREIQKGGSHAPED